MTSPDDNNYSDEPHGDGTSDNGSRMVTLSRDEIRSMERDAKQARQAMEKVETLQRELAFARSGQEFSDKQQKALLSVVDGDLTPEAIRAAAAELGFTGSPAGGGDTTDRDMQTFERVNAASAGSATPPAAPPDMNAAIRNAAGR